MKTHDVARKLFVSLAWAALFAGGTGLVWAAPSTLLYQDDFNRGIPGWEAVQPPGTYFDGPMRWQYDIVSGAFVEQSNIYTDNAGASTSATAVMLINQAVAPNAFTFRARLTAGDDDGFGLIFGYQDPETFYRVTFARQVRKNGDVPAGFPWNGWNVDGKVSGVVTNLFGDGTPSHDESFINTSGQPFDVTIQVSSGNRLTLTVVDDPDGAAIQYLLVDNQPLPGTAGGRVGLMTWGMSGSVPRGFRIQNLSLEPVPLVGDPNDLHDWTYVLPPRSDGIAPMGGGNGGQPIWSLSLGANGAYGTLVENSDSYGGNDAEGNIDFVAGALVAGDPQWTDYVVRTRIIPGDDDGEGLLLRYQDENNFYRVAFRAQNSTVGVPQGLSIQKKVDGTYEEVYRDTDPVFIPAAGTPYDLLAAITGNRLRVVVISDPSGASQVFSYGPFDITGATVDHGRIGLFSWAMSQVEFDSVRVEDVEGIPLEVSSPFGTADPPVGLNGFPQGTQITATVPDQVEDTPGVRRIPTGWTGFGSIPASGAGSSVTFTLDSFSFLNWQWRTEYRVTTSAETGGSVNISGESWYPEGTNLTVTAQAEPGYLFTGWSGDTLTTSKQLDLTVNRPLQLTAHFSADSDADGLPDAWEKTYFGDLSTTADSDPDQDGRSNLTEYQDGTNPNFKETQTDTFGFSSRWENTQRDPILPGQWQVMDFGSGYRGVWEDSNDYRGADDPTIIGESNIVANVSFDGPRLLIRPDVWQNSWSNFTAQAVFTVGDNDGNCVYFRYQDEMNWYRVTVVGEDTAADWRAPFGVSIQKRVNGQFTQLASDARIATDPADVAWYKKIRITVKATGSDFEVHVIGWNAYSTPPDWLASSEVVIPFTDDSLPNGRFGIGDWGQGADPTPPTAQIPVDDGVQIDNIVVDVSGQEVFREDWENFPLADELPSGWTNALAGTGLAGDWRVSADGSLMQLANDGSNPTSTAAVPQPDGEGPILLAPVPSTANYQLRLGFHPFDDDGIGFVYDFQDTNNYARVLFVSQPSGDARIPQGVNIARKINGTWSAILLGDASFVYQPGHPFAVEFANNNGDCLLNVHEMDTPDTLYTWRWTDTPASQSNRFGLATWAETDAHFLYANALGLPQLQTATPLEITQVTVAGGMLTLHFANPNQQKIDIEQSPDLSPGSWSTAESGVTSESWSTPLPTALGQGFWRLSAAP